MYQWQLEYGAEIGKLKKSLDGLVNERESLYEERRNVIHSVREAGAKLEMIETQLNAIAFKKSRMQAAETRHRRQKEVDDRRVARQEAIQERQKRDKEYQERWAELEEPGTIFLALGDSYTIGESVKGRERCTLLMHPEDAAARGQRSRAARAEQRAFLRTSAHHQRHASEVTQTRQQRLEHGSRDSGAAPRDHQVQSEIRCKRQVFEHGQQWVTHGCGDQVVVVALPFGLGLRHHPRVLRAGDQRQHFAAVEGAVARRHRSPADVAAGAALSAVRLFERACHEPKIVPRAGRRIPFLAVKSTRNLAMRPRHHRESDNGKQHGRDEKPSRGRRGNRIRVRVAGEDQKKANHESDKADLRQPELRRRNTARGRGRKQVVKHAVNREADPADHQEMRVSGHL